ncbi:MAG: putative phosphoribosyl transferase [Natronomonas sp.]|jgi:putative phosphoribosyl transferase
MYDNRTTAGRVLKEQLLGRDVRPDVVLAVPPGGINVARPICDTFDADLGLIVSEPIRMPSTRNHPIGAVTDTGIPWIDEALVDAFEVDEEKLDVEKQQAFREARNKHEVYAEVVGDPTPAGTVAIVDEGLGSTMRMRANLAAIDSLEETYTVAAAPVGMPDDIAALHSLADDVVVDEAKSDGEILDQFYDDFDRGVLPQ